MVTVRFRCGHRFGLDPDKTPNPRCLTCGETRIAGVVGAPPPRIVGHARGPLVESKHLEPIAVSVATRPLTLKPEDDRGE